MIKIYLDEIELGNVYSDSKTYCTNVYMGGSYRNIWSSQNEGSFWDTEVSKSFCRPFTEIFNCLYNAESEKEVLSMLFREEKAIIDEARNLPLDMISAIKLIIKRLTDSTELEGRVSIKGSDYN